MWRPPCTSVSNIPVVVNGVMMLMMLKDGGGKKINMFMAHKGERRGNKLGEREGQRSSEVFYSKRKI